MREKEISVVFYRRDFVSDAWHYAVDMEGTKRFLDSFSEELKPLGVLLRYWEENDTVIPVKGYGDLLNTVRLRSPKDCLANICLGHVIGQSAQADLIDDIRRGISRVAFAPEMVEPEGSDKIVCHNCGCGC